MRAICVPFKNSHNTQFSLEFYFLNIFAVFERAMAEIRNRQVLYTIHVVGLVLNRTHSMESNHVLK